MNRVAVDETEAPRFSSPGSRGYSPSVTLHQEFRQRSALALLWPKVLECPRLFPGMLPKQACPLLILSQGPPRHESTNADIPALERVRSLSSHTRCLAMSDQLPQRHFVRKRRQTPDLPGAILSCSQHGQPPPVSHAAPRFGKGTRDVSGSLQRDLVLDPAPNFTLADSERLPATSEYLIPYPAYSLDNRPFEGQPPLSKCTLYLCRCRHEGTFPQLVTHTCTHHGATYWSTQ